MYKLLNNEKIINKKILLIDDIFTTGSTVNECSKILKLAGAKKIDILTIAKDKKIKFPKKEPALNKELA